MLIVWERDCALAGQGTHSFSGPRLSREVERGHWNALEDGSVRSIRSECRRKDRPIRLRCDFHPRCPFWQSNTIGQLIMAIKRALSEAFNLRVLGHQSDRFANRQGDAVLSRD